MNILNRIKNYLLIENFNHAREKWHNDGNDYEYIDKIILKFKELKAKNRIAQNAIDIGFWMKKDIKELEKYLSEIEKTPSKSEIKKGYKKDAEIVFNNDELMIVIPKTAEASCIYGAGTKWCISAKKGNMFHSYTSTIPLKEQEEEDVTHASTFYFLIFKKTKEKYALLVNLENEMTELYDYKDQRIERGSNKWNHVFSELKRMGAPTKFISYLIPAEKSKKIEERPKREPKKISEITIEKIFNKVINKDVTYPIKKLDKRILEEFKKFIFDTFKTTQILDSLAIKSEDITVTELRYILDDKFKNILRKKNLLDKAYFISQSSKKKVPYDFENYIHVFLIDYIELPENEKYYEKINEIVRHNYNINTPKYKFKDNK